MTKYLVASYSLVSVLVLIILRQEGVLSLSGDVLAYAVAIAATIGAVIGIISFSGRSLRVEKLDHDCLTERHRCNH
ncbi:MAG: hypothetical protein AAGJ87_06685 [Pseudomonadota bacterium]